MISKSREANTIRNFLLLSLNSEKVWIQLALVLKYKIAETIMILEIATLNVLNPKYTKHTLKQAYKRVKCISLLVMRVRCDRSQR